MVGLLVLSAWAVPALGSHSPELKWTGIQDVPKPKVTASVSQTSIRPGKSLSGKLTIEVPTGYHGYQNPPRQSYQIPISLSATDAKLKLVPKYPKGITKVSMGEESDIYDGKVEIPFSFTAPSKVGKYTLELKVGYQFCDDTSCFSPESVKVKLNYTVSNSIAVKKVRKP